MTLSDARDAAVAWKALIQRGIDPHDDQRRQRAEVERRRLEQRSLADALDEYDKERLSELRRGKATRRALDGNMGLLTAFRDREIASIQRSEILQALRQRRGVSPISANRQLAYAKAFFNWCVEQELIPANPAEKISRPSRENQRDRHHSPKELGEIWHASASLGYPFGLLIKLMIVLPMRREEIAAMTLAELVLGEADQDGIWTLPAERTKRSNALRVPLSPLARSIIKDAVEHAARPSNSEFVFTTTGNTSVSGFAKAKRRLDKLIAESREKAGQGGPEPARGMPHWTLHDLRTTFATIACEDLAVDAAVADRILNHVASSTTSKIMRTYNKSELFDARRQALNAWADYLSANVARLGAVSEELPASPR